MKKQSLFAEFEDDESNVPAIPGLQYVPDFLDRRQERDLIAHVDSNEWLDDLARRVQHYGFKYDYGHGPLRKTNPLPQWATYVGKRLQEEKFMPQVPNQLIVNEYQPGQGISPHVDREDQFGETVISLSLGSQITMDFIKKDTREKVSLLLDPRSLVVLSGEARHEWMHGIPGRLSDEVEGERITRTRRVSLTFRTVESK